MNREPKTILEEEEVGAKDPINVQDNADIVAERELGLKDNQGINARDLVKNFKVKPEKDSKSKYPIVKRAVKGVSFGIRENEIYALLGPNGSGKTVTMSMLAGKYTPCFGAVALDGSVASSNDSSIDHLYNRCNIAYCPQFDALFPKNTVKEHIEFYATIRGLDLNEKATIDHISAIVKLLGLKKHLNKETTELSGGYKRRLSLAIAVIGYPNVLIVDEVTTGVDPGARREIWDLLKPSSTHDDFNVPATILSSHYMDECQELGTRIGILIDGEIVATGNISRLNELFCTSYFVEISLESHVGEDAEQNVIDVFEKHQMFAESYEIIPYRLKFRVPFVKGSGQNDTKQLASIFKLLEENKETIGIKFYSVAPMNLEQIFIDLSRK
jgi:ABC-type multidrug transport system ATPase subunit